MKEITVTATLDQIPVVTAFLDEQLETAGCPMKTQMQLDIALDELFSNIARYAYAPNTGEATVQVAIVPDPRRVSVTFIDRGIPYNPLEKTDPDITLGADEREIGGLGIFMVKKTMDSLHYERREGQNILTIEKFIP